MSKYLISVIAIVAVLSFASTAPVVVYAQTGTESTQQTEVEPIVIPVNTIIRGDAGSQHVLAAKTVPNGEYNVTVISENQSSVHPDSDISVTTNGDEVVVKDVESAKFEEKTAEGTLNVTDGKITVYLTLGPDKVFSGGVKVVLALVPPKEEPKQVEVCDPKTRKIISVEESEYNNYLPVDATACQEDSEQPGEVIGRGSDVPPDELPSTGIGMAIGGAIGAGAIYLGVHNWLISRRELLSAFLKK